MRGSAAFRAAVAPGGVLAGPWVKNDLWRRAKAAPSLDLRFADNKSLVDATTGQNLVTFTRASSGTYVGSDGLIKTATTNEARFDHNPTTGESLGLLVEEQRTNSLLYSEQFDNAYWTKTSATVVANAIAAPNGTLTGAKLITSNTLASGRVSATVTLTIGASATLSCFAKQGESNAFTLYISDGVGKAATFNLATGTISGAPSSGLTARIKDAGSGWYKCEVSLTSAAQTSGSIRIQHTIAVGDGTSGIYIWGSQFEAGAFSTSYIPTTTATVTRSADVASITGANFSSWYNQSQGSLYCNFATSGADTVNNRGIVAIDDDSNNNRVTLFIPLGSAPLSIGSRVVSGGSATNPPNAGSISVNSQSKGVLAYGVGTSQAALSVDGSSPGTASPSAAPSGVNQLRIGLMFGTTYLGGTIRRLTYWPQRLPNSTLQEITR